MRIESIRLSGNALDCYVDLFRICFPKAAHLNRAYLNWLYVFNPFGRAVGFDAWDGSKLVAHYACIPHRFGRDRSCLVSLNTATHPGYQGKGLFTKLASKTYEKASELGFQCVFGVANANSTPGFVRKLGFHLVSPLEADIVWMSRTEVAMTTPAYSFARDQNFLDWRIRANPRGHYRRHRMSEHYDLISAPTSIPGLRCVAEIPHEDVGSRLRPPIMVLSMGLNQSHFENRTRWPIPMKLRPSPLNLIFRDLSGLRAPMKSDISWSFLDFDAY